MLVGRTAVVVGLEATLLPTPVGVDDDSPDRTRGSGKSHLPADDNPTPNGQHSPVLPN